MRKSEMTNSPVLLTIHEAAKIFPDMPYEAYNELKEDIRNHGQLMPIIVQKGRILDGRHRYRACLELGIQPIFEEAPISNEPAQRLIMSLNLHRRHMSESQRAMVAARLANLAVGDNQHTAQAVTQTEAASDLHVSVDSLQRAKSVINLGSEQLVQAVINGKLDVSNAAAIATMPERAQNELLHCSDKEVLAKAKSIRKERAAERRSNVLAAIAAKREKNVPLDPNSGPYGVVYADPAWDYLSELNVGYPTMSLEEICAMPVSQIAAEDAVLFLWCSASLMREALTVIDAWGFTYKTQAIWDKGVPGQGMYFRVQHEVLMLATRGNLPEVPPSVRASSIMSFPRREHSRKPDYGYELIETMYPELNKIELFCRGEAKNSGWAVWGNESIPAANTVKQLVHATVVEVHDSQPPANNATFEKRRGRRKSQDKQAA
jgi:N6-adenosine-specific RNA methylase IME4/ParB-like chromosome segregation protein Spo0J